MQVIDKVSDNDGGYKGKGRSKDILETMKGGEESDMRQGIQKDDNETSESELIGLIGVGRAVP